MKHKSFSLSTLVVHGVCPYCKELTPLVSIEENIYKCVTCGDEVEQYVKDNKSKVKYYYTSFGSQNDEAKNFISKLVSSVKNSSHMETNTDAVNNL